MKHTPSKTYARALTIATSDSGGGAGIQADLKAFAARGCYGMSVLAALTAQNTAEVRGIHALPVDFVGLQIDAVVEDIGVDAVKIGMLFNSDIMSVVAERLQAHRLEQVVLDPVMVSQSGAKLIRDTAVETMVDKLFPLCTLITPNLPEAETLLGREIRNDSEVEQAATDLLELGPDSVLLKGGHFSSEVSRDCLVTQNAGGEKKIFWFEGERVATENTHGTGCTLSSAIAAGLAKGNALPESVDYAKKYVTGAIRAGSRYEIGKGSGPLHHFYELWDKQPVQTLSPNNKIEQ